MKHLNALALSLILGTLPVGCGNHSLHAKITDPPNSAPATAPKVRNLPDPAPPFEATLGKRAAADFNVSSLEADEGIVEQPALWFGNKHFDIIDRRGYARNQDQCVSLSIDNRRVLLIQFWGALKNLGYGYPFQMVKGQPPQLKFDAVTKTITFLKPYALPGGGTAPCRREHAS